VNFQQQDKEKAKKTAESKIASKRLHAEQTQAKL
jgi:hypothetical protein